MVEATLVCGRHTRIHWSRSGHSISELMLSTTSGVHRRPVVHSVGATGRPVAKLATTASYRGLSSCGARSLQSGQERSAAHMVLEAPAC